LIVLERVGVAHVVQKMNEYIVGDPWIL